MHMYNTYFNEIAKAVKEEMLVFENILEPRRQEVSNFIWASRELHAKVPYIQLRKLGPVEMKLEVLNSPKIQSLIEKECAEGCILKEDILNKIRNILDEIGYDKKLQLIRWLGLVLAKITTQVCSGIYVNKSSIISLRNGMGNVPVMYVPSHRSYADFILMSYICFHYDIEIPAIAAGMDFHAMRGMGTVLRNTGAFFMRRTYNDDRLYWDTFREYVHQVVVKGQLGIEFFIEGTRSRSGKSLHPKLGLFSMILKAFFNGEVPDILFVPINISYERIMEEKLFAFELLGVPKPKESTSAFFKSLSMVKEKYGNVYVNFGEPLSAHQYFADKIDRSEHSTKPLHMQIANKKEREATSLFAETIVRHQQKLCVITTFNLIAIVIIETFIYKKNKLTVDILMHKLIWLRNIMEKFGAVTNFDNSLGTVLDIFAVHRNLIQLCENNEVKLVGNTEVAGKIDRTKLRGHQLQDEVMTRSVPLLTIQLYVNPTLHYFINPSLVTTVLKKYSGCNGVAKDILFTEYSFLRSLFKREFVLFAMYEQLEFEDSIRILQETNVLKNDGIIYLQSNENLGQLLCNLLQPFFITYYVACRILSYADNPEYPESHIFCTVQFQIEKLLNSNISINPYSLNLDTISNCIQSLCELRVLKKIRRNNSPVYIIQHESISTIFRKLDSYVVNLIPELKANFTAKL